MEDAFSTVWQTVTWLIGLCVFLGLMWWIVRANAFWWRKVGADYAGRPPSRPLARKVPETIVVTGRPASRAAIGYRVYGASVIAIHSDGLALDQIPPLNIHCPPLFLPFDEMVVKETDWMLWPDAYVIRMQRCPDIDIIVARRVILWVREHVDAPPFGLGV